MPLYSFRCPECGQERDIPLRLAEMDEPQHCKNVQCSRTTPIVRQSTSASLQFKGSGWTPKHY